MGDLVDIGIVEVVLEEVEEVGVGELVVGDDAVAQNVEGIHVVHVHRHRRTLLVHVGVVVHRRRPHPSLSLSLSTDSLSPSLSRKL